MGISRKIAEAMKSASWIRRMFEEGARLKAEHGAENVYDFSLGNPVVEPPAEVIAALTASAATREPGAHRYMQNAGYPAVRSAVAEHLAGKTGLPFEGSGVVMCVGAGGGLNVIMKTILDPGDEVIVLTPFFVEYVFYVDNHGGRTVRVPTDERFLPDVEAIRAAITERTKAVIVNSPNNPTGVTYPKSSLDALGAMLTEESRRLGRRIFLITDEPYRYIAYDIDVPWVAHSYPDTILVTSHSKDLALPGERIGFIAPTPGMDVLGDSRRGTDVLDADARIRQRAGDPAARGRAAPGTHGRPRDLPPQARRALA